MSDERQEVFRKTSNQEPSKGTMLELLSYPNMRRKFCILTFLWLANSVAYNGLSYNSSNLGVSDTLAFFINAIVEAPAYILTWWAMGKWGRRWVTCLTMLLGGLACCCCMLVPEGKYYCPHNVLRDVRYCLNFQNICNIKFVYLI